MGGVLMVALEAELLTGAPGKARAEDVLEALAVLVPRGRASAVKASFLAGRLGVSERTVRALVGELIDRGVPIGSTSSGESGGYFVCVDRDDFDAAARNLRPRALAILHRWSVLQKAAAERIGPEALRLFDLDGGA
jgi:predicted DNA-binding transcriptional regulator YafY